MKRYLAILVVLILVPSSSSAQAQYGMYESTRGVTESYVIWYMNSNLTAFELVLDTVKGNVFLRMLMKDGSLGDEELKLLKAEVTRFIQAKGPVLLGGSGYVFHFTGNYPLWEPHGTGDEAGRSYMCVFFAEGGSIKNRIIHAQGQKTSPKGLALNESN